MIGVYFRNRYGIAKVIDIEKVNGIEVLVFDKNVVFMVNKETGKIRDDILTNKLALLDNIDLTKIKHSKEIIDLIEEGDIIEYDSNNWGTDILEVVVEVCPVKEDYDKGEGFVCTALDDNIRKKHIKSIITKEQIEKIKYEVKI